LAFDQRGLERLDTQTVQRRCAVQENRMLADNLVEDIPNLGTFLFDQLLGLLDRGREALGVKARVDEGLEQLKRHLLRQAALVQLQLRTRHDDRTAGIVDALADQVLAEPALLALQHVGQRLQRARVGAGDDAAATAVIDQRLDRFRKHADLVADDDAGVLQLDEALQTVVTVDHTAIEIVQIRGRETAAIERDQRAQVRRNDRNDLEDHPFRLVAGIEEVLDHLEALQKLLLLQLRRGGGEFRTQIAGDLLQFHRRQQMVNRFRADHGGEGILAILVNRQHVLLFGEKLVRLQSGQTRLGNDVVLEVEHALNILERHVKQRADAARQRLQEPDVGDGCCELDMAHALTAHTRQRHFHAALLADDALVLHALVLAAQALIILDRTKDAGAEKTVTFGLERTVVNRLRLFDLAVGPGQNLLRACDRNPGRVKSLGRRLRVEQVHDLLVHADLLCGTSHVPKFSCELA